MTADNLAWLRRTDHRVPSQSHRSSPCNCPQREHYVPRDLGECSPAFQRTAYRRPPEQLTHQKDNFRAKTASKINADKVGQTLRMKKILNFS